MIRRVSIARLVVLYFLAIVPVSLATAQPALVIEPDSLILVENTELFVTNTSAHVVRVDSIKFSEHPFASGWTIDIEVADTSLQGLYFIFGQLYECVGNTEPCDLFPKDLIVNPSETMSIRVSGFDWCVACKREDVQETRYLDTLFIYTDEHNVGPYQVVLDHTDFMVSVESPPVTQNASVDVYPSPASSAATVDVRFDEPLAASITAIDILGRHRQLITGNAGVSDRHAIQVTVGDWPPGLYMIRVEGVRGGRVIQTASAPMVVVR